MLVLSRKLGEKIHIGDDIVITIVKIDRNQVRIGIQAPLSVPVYREEIVPLAQLDDDGAADHEALVAPLDVPASAPLARVARSARRPVAVGAD